MSFERPPNLNVPASFLPPPLLAPSAAQALKLVERKCFFLLCWANELEESVVDDVRRVSDPQAAS